MSNTMNNSGLSGLEQELQNAWDWRREKGLVTEACRVFHGPGEGSGALADLAIDLFGHHAWVTLWSQDASRALPAVQVHLQKNGVYSAVALLRPERGLPEEPTVLFGEPPSGKIAVREGPIQVLIQFLGTRHPGLFLDHYPLRQWLHQRMRNLSVLNTFAYTGSLSLAAAAGGARHVTTLDLSRPTIDWARENWRANGFPETEEASNFIFGDVFEWLPRLSRSERRYDCVILDPPSFSRGKKGTFSTAKDLERLHFLALSVLEDKGYLITSINSANVPRAKYLADVQSAARAQGFSLEILEEVRLPETFPARSETDRYLKGWIFQARRAR